MKKVMFKKVANSFAGRMLCRLMGEEKGSVMIEYILIALLIVVVGVVVFTMLGGVLGGTGEAVAQGITGQDNATIKTTVDNVASYADTKAGESKTRVENMHRGADKKSW